MLTDLPKNQEKNSKISSLKFRLYIALLIDVLVDSFPKAIGATISTNPLKAGREWKFIDCKINSIKPNAEPGESPYTGKLKLTPIIEGISKQTLAWMYENLGKDVIVVWERCSDGQKFLGGSPCSGGMSIKFTSIGAQDGGIDGIALSLEGGECPEPFWFYDGPIVREDPQSVSLSGGTTFALTAKSQYTMTDNAGAKTLTDITAVSDSDVGRIIELIGAGVTNPTSIANSEKFILRGGLSFSAKVGNSISFQITKTASGYAFFEVYRS